MADPIKIMNNMPFLQVTGTSKGVHGINYTPQEHIGGGVTGGQVELPSFRAVDKIPPLEMATYQENIPPQAGRSAGVSSWMIRA